MATSTIAHNPTMPVTGETLSFDLGCFGFVSTGAQVLYLWAPTNRTTNATISFSTSQVLATLDARSIGGNFAAYMNIKPYLQTIELLTSGQIYIEAKKTDGWGVTNNTPVAGHVNLTIQV